MTEANVNEHAAAMVERKARRMEGRLARAEAEAASRYLRKEHKQEC